MRLPDLAIKRPVLAIVFSAVLVLFGLFSYQSLSVREYPDIDSPNVSIQTSYRGASAEIIESQITQVIEDAVAGISGVERISSTSREEYSTVGVEFSLNRDIESATNDVRDRISRIVNQLPEEADPPRISKSESDARPILWLSLTSDRFNQLELTDYAERNLVDPLSTVDGVANVRIGGARRYAMRIWLDTPAMAARGITVADIEYAIREQNVQIPSGRIESNMREFSIKTQSDLRTAEEFRRIILYDYADGRVRLGDVAEVEIAPENDRTNLRVNGQTAIGLGVVRQSGANVLEVANGVKKIVERLQNNLPTGLNIQVSYDQSVFISQSIKEVFFALGVAMVLVILVIFFFLRSIAATFIPAVAIPVSIIATLTILGALDYSVNVLTLLALVLAIGLVVDDAIVVLENIHRRIEAGEPPLLAASRGAKQVGFAVVATTIVLIAVFIPISFLDGTTGRLFREFGVAVAAAVMFSSFVALTLTPMLCSKLLVETNKEGWFYKSTERLFTGLAALYGGALKWTLKIPLVVVAIAIGFSALAYNFYEIIPKEFAPTEDRGVFYMPVKGPEGATMEYTRNNVDRIEEVLKPLEESGEARRLFAFLGTFRQPGPVNEAFMLVGLVPWEQRERSQQEIVNEVFPKLLAIPGVKVYAINPASLGQRGFSAPVRIIIGGPSYDIINEWVDRVIERAQENPQLLNITKDFEETQPQIHLDIDRARASNLGVTIETIGRTLETLMGARNVTTYDQGGKQYEVIVQARKEDRGSRDDLSNVYVRSEVADQLIPLSGFVTLREEAGPGELKRTDRLRTIEISASLGPDYTLEKALNYLETIVREEAGEEATISYDGLSRSYKDSNQALVFTFVTALLVVFLALAAQFESFIHPMIIMTTVPLAITGALGSILLAGLTLNIYSQIGMIMLIGLTAKNAILIVEFANQLRDEGADILTAIQESAIIRLRPILMTTISTALGAVPLAIATGAGAESREAIGIVIIGGLIFSTVLSLFVVPVVYILLARFSRPSGYLAARLNELEAAHSDIHK
ncbi:efflux RND transporter permease subunit [Sneathiella sp.]|uniref:efflux RND transporter permease subunit n=1 Tax=Sneathiella sp. TaxID=1964365 RepID=UPI0026022E30|nr:efflux RND transporter permease subunit [Sneathiella sp.]MDF2366786.1 efflux RND transporter permease subunit [Sneathiella sp.]